MRKAASLFSRGSQAHRMSRAANGANDTYSWRWWGYRTARPGVTATATLVLKGSARGTGQVRLDVCGETVAIAIASGDSAGVLMVSLIEAINTWARYRCRRVWWISRLRHLVVKLW